MPRTILNEGTEDERMEGDGKKNLSPEQARPRTLSEKLGNQDIILTPATVRNIVYVGKQLQLSGTKRSRGRWDFHRTGNSYEITKFDRDQDTEPLLIMEIKSAENASDIPYIIDCANANVDTILGTLTMALQTSERRLAESEKKSAGLEEEIKQLKIQLRLGRTGGKL